MESEQGIVSKTREFVEELFAKNADRFLPFHSRQHTIEVVEAAEEIGRKVGLGSEDMEIVTVAAWLHDIGYFNTYAGHEEESALMSREFLESADYPKDRIRRVVGCILATRMPQRPNTLAERVLCDADMSHLGTDDLPKRTEKLRREWGEYSNESVSDLEWMEQNLQFMEEHRFFTEPAREAYAPVLAQHIVDLKERIAAKKPGGSGTISVKEKEKRDEKKKKLKKLKKKIRKLEGKVDEELSPGEPHSIKTSAARHDRGIETMFRTTSANHIDLSSMADSKANILISVNSIIVSIVASLLIGKLDTNPQMVIPTLILISVCLTTIVLSILATRPKVTSGTFTQEDVEAKRVNLLFFGNFHGVRLEDYENGVYSMMQDPDYLYSSLIRDIYFLGNVLGKKYRYLRFAYNVFMYGLIVTVIAFATTILYSGGPATDLLEP